MSTSANFSRIPIVDIAKLRNGMLAEQKAVAEELGKAAGTVGFVYVIIRWLRHCRVTLRVISRCVPP